MRFHLAAATLLLAVSATAAPAPADTTPHAAGAAADSSAAAPECARGLDLFRAGRHADAEPLLAACAGDAGGSLETLIALSVICIDDDRGGDAESWGGRAVARYPASPDAHYWYGRALLADGDSLSARHQWERGLVLAPEHPGLLEALARLLLANGQEQPAYGLLTQLVRVNGGTPAVHRTMSRIAQKRSLWREALDHWQKSLVGGAAPADLRIASELGIMAGDTAYAVEAGQRAVAADASAESQAVLGEACFAARRYEGAEKALRAALALDPDQQTSRFHLANTLELLGRTEEADQEFRRYVAARPDDPVGYFNFAVHLDEAGRTHEALAAARQACDLGPKLAQARLLVARLLEKTGQDDALAAALDTLLADGIGDAKKLTTWKNEVAARRQQDADHRAAGEMQLLHIAVPDSEAAAAIAAQLKAGVDFAVLATAHSVSPEAARGGDIGWIDPRQMVAPLRDAVATLKPQENSPPVESGGLVHFFRRVR